LIKGTAMKARRVFVKESARPDCQAGRGAGILLRQLSLGGSKVRISSSRTLRVLSVIAGIVLLGDAMAVAPVSAAPAKPGAAGAMSGHCVIKLRPGLNKAAAQSCFGTFTEALSYASGGVVTDAPAKATSSEALTAKIEAANTAALNPHAGQAAPLVIGIEFSEPSGAGWTLTLSGTVSCTFATSDIDYSLDLPSVAWDQISSFTSFNVCYSDHYFLQNFGLPRTGFFSGQPLMPSMSVGGGPFNGDNNTRSITWS
jgi:hypothetical protein